MPERLGQGEHHAVALDRAGTTLFDKALPNDWARLREILASLGKHGRILLVIDEPATIGALPVAVVQAAGVMVGYLPGLTTRRIADLHARRNPMRGVRSTSPTRPGQCPTPCARSSSVRGSGRALSPSVVEHRDKTPPVLASLVARTGGIIFVTSRTNPECHCSELEGDESRVAGRGKTRVRSRYSPRDRRSEFDLPMLQPARFRYRTGQEGRAVKV